jgi:capsular polysaccharide biosynthesis protein
MFYVRPEIQIVDVQANTHKLGFDIMNFYKSVGSALHEIFFFTQKPKRIELGDAWGTNPYHLFFYMLSRFYYVDNGDTEIIYYYPKRNTDFFTEGAFAALPSRFKREVNKDEAFEYVELPGCKWRYDSIDEPWMYEYMRDLYKDVWSSTKQQKGKYTYIIRDPVSTSYRRILNHKEVITMAKQEGFSIYDMGNLTFVEQIRLFRSSEFILGVHGAALSFLVFCEPGTQVLEIYPNRPGKNHYYDLSSKMGLRYGRFTGLDFFNEENEDMTVNLDLFYAVIKHLKLSRQNS